MMTGPFEKAMHDGLNGEQWDWDDAKGAAMHFLAANAGDLSQHKEKCVVYAVKNMIMTAYAMQSIINDNITDTHMPEEKMFQIVTELKDAVHKMDDKEHVGNAKHMSTGV